MVSNWFPQRGTGGPSSLGRSPGNLVRPWLAMYRGQGYGSMRRSGLYEG